MVNTHANKVVITGGPGSGKTTIINHLKAIGFVCIDEVSRQITLQARHEGIEQLFLTKPLAFSKRLLKDRIQQFSNAMTYNTSPIFFDRGLPDIIAYMDYIDTVYPIYFSDACNINKYDYAFVLPPWQDIFKSDSERYENFEQATKIYQYLLATYKRYGYTLIEVPFGNVKQRTDFILNYLNLK